MSSKNKRHEWRTTTPEGEKREVRATRFGKTWRFQSKIKGQEEWTYYDHPPREDAEELLEILKRKYQRNRVPYEDVRSVEKLLGIAPEPQDQHQP
jgi:hypothetical protein